MARKRSAMKAHRVSERRRIRNRTVRSSVRSLVKKARLSLATGVVEEAKVTVIDAAKVLDNAANKGVIHRRQASRRKSRLMKRLAVVVSAPPVAETAAEAPRARRTRAAAGTATPRARRTAR